MKPVRLPSLLPLLLLFGIGGWSCTDGLPEPEALRLHDESCAWCRMAIGDPKLAAQLLAPNEEPKFFDEIGCLRDHLAAQKTLPDGAVAYVADHRTGRWIRADRAVYAKAPGLDTPMGSHLIAHENAASRREDPRAAGSVPLAAADVFGPAGPPQGNRRAEG